MRYSVPKDCKDLSLSGVQVEIIDGFIDVNTEHTFLVENGFTPIYEEAPITPDGGETLPSIEDVKKEADELGIQYAQNIGVKKLLEKIAEFKANQAPINPDGGEA